MTTYEQAEKFRWNPFDMTNVKWDVCELSCKIKGIRVVVCLFANGWQNMSFCCSGQDLIQDFF